MMLNPVRFLKRILSADAVYWMLFWLLMLTVATGYGFYIDGQQDQAQCESRNQATEDGAVILLETLIEVSGGDAEPGTITEIRRVLRRNLDEIKVDC